jgi:hypothetical protein
MRHALQAGHNIGELLKALEHVGALDATPPSP